VLKQPAAFAVSMMLAMGSGVRRKGQGQRNE